MGVREVCPRRKGRLRNSGPSQSREGPGGSVGEVERNANSKQPILT